MEWIHYSKQRAFASQQRVRRLFTEWRGQKLVDINKEIIERAIIIYLDRLDRSGLTNRHDLPLAVRVLQVPHLETIVI